LNLGVAAHERDCDFAAQSMDVFAVGIAALRMRVAAEHEGSMVSCWRVVDGVQGMRERVRGWTSGVD